MVFAPAVQVPFTLPKKKKTSDGCLLNSFLSVKFTRFISYDVQVGFLHRVKRHSQLHTESERKNKQRVNGKHKADESAVSGREKVTSSDLRSNRMENMMKTGRNLATPEENFAHFSSHFLWTWGTWFPCDWIQNASIRHRYMAKACWVQNEVCSTPETKRRKRSEAAKIR